MNTADSATPLAIIGIGCLFPGADNMGAYWARIRNRVDAIGGVPPTHWRPEDYYHPDPKAPDRIYTARGGF
ncbi:MAG TPA: beta-ketoacyl synthase N-terminal-like domain-containing protein, partial [Gemmataceae bacterium]